MDTVCPKCNGGKLLTEYDFNIIEYPKELIQVNYFHSVCSSCKFETVTPQQNKFNRLINELGYMLHDNTLNINELDKISKFIVNKCVRVVTKN